MRDENEDKETLYGTEEEEEVQISLIIKDDTALTVSSHLFQMIIENIT